MGIDVLGNLVVGSAQTPSGRRDRVVIEVLAMRHGRPVSADQLADALWGDAPPESAHKVLQGCILRLRRLLGADVIETLPQGYRLAVAADEIDAQRFERLVARAREVLALGESERAEYLASEALALWRGPAFAELEEWEPGRIEAGRLNELRLEAEELRVDASLRAGRFREILADAQAMVNEAPLRERRWALLTLAQYQAGNQGEALRIIHHVRTLLVQKLGLDPSPDIDVLEQAILRQDPALTAAQALVRTHERCPYQGLAPYDVGDNESFFGRDADVAICLQRIRAGEPVAVVGASGSGKSSLVRAGVAAALRREGRRVVLISPGARPMDALADLDAGRGAALIVDQCEEVFSLCGDQDERGRFLAGLVEHAERSPLVVALRADHLADVALYPAFARIVERGLHLLTAMTAHDLRLAIEQPARQAGLQIEPGLVDLLVREVENKSGALPLLSHTLQETWQRREGTVLTVDGYRATGGIRGAVAQSAEDIYAHTASGQRHLLRDLLLRLVSPGVEGEPVRSRMLRRLVVSDPAQDELLDHLVAARLVTSDDAVVEIAHEALARAWPRLRAWLDDDVEGLRIRHHVTGAADAWERLGRPDSELYRGVRLAKAREWRLRNDPVLTSVEAAFLTESERLAEAEERTAAMQARRQARMIRRLRTSLGVGAVLLVVALLASGLAAHEADNSNQALGRARSAEAASDSHRLGADALLSSDPSLASLLALEGLKLTDDTASRNNFLDVLMHQMNLMWTSRPIVAGPNVLSGLSVSEDGTRIAAYSSDNTVSILDSHGNIVKPLRIKSAEATYPKGPVEFSPTQPVIAVGAQGYGKRAIVLYDSQTLEPLAHQLRHLPIVPASVWDLDYTADGRYLAASFAYKRPPTPSAPAKSIMVWDLSHPAAPPQVVVGAGAGSDLIALSDDGRHVYGSWPVTGFDVATGRVLFRDPQLLSDSPIDLSHDGNTLALGIGYNTPRFPDFDYVQVVDTKTGDVTRQLPTTRAVFSAQFSPDGSLLAAGDGGGHVQVWETANYETVLDLATGRVNALAFAPDGSTLFTAGLDGTVRAWDLSWSRALISKVPITGAPFIAGQTLLSPDGTTLAVDAWKTSRNFIDLENGRQATVRRKKDLAGWPLANDEPVAAAWAPDSRIYATGGRDRAHISDGVVETYDAHGHLLNSAQVSAPVTGVAYTPAGRRLVVTELTGRVDVLESATLDAVGPSVDLPSTACCVAVAPDGNSAFVLLASDRAVGGSAPTWDQWRVIDLTDGSVSRSGSLDGVIGLDVAYSPDSERVAVAASDNTMRLIDVRTGEQLNQPVPTAVDEVHYSVAFDSTGKRVVTSSWDGGTIALWDGHTGVKEEVLPLGEWGNPQFTDDDQAVQIGTYSGTAYVWHFGGDRPEEAACVQAGRNLTRPEWDAYLPGRPYQAVCPQFPIEPAPS